MDSNMIVQLQYRSSSYEIQFDASETAEITVFKIIEKLKNEHQMISASLVSLFQG